MRRSRSRYSVLEDRSRFSRQIPGAERSKDGVETLVQKDEQDPLGMYPSVVQVLRARSLEAVRKKPGRTEYQRGIVSTGPDGALQVRTTGNQGSGVLSSMVQANGLIVLHHGQGNVAAGDAVDVMVFEGVV